MFDQQTVLDALKIYHHSPDYHFWKDDNNIFRMINERMAKDFGHKSDAISFEGITDYQHSSKVIELADEFIKKDTLVIRESSPIATLELFYNCNNELRFYYVRKTPIINEEGKTIGVAGFAADSTHCPLIRSALILLRKNDKLIPKASAQIVYHIKPRFNEFDLTPRQSEVLFYMIRGRTAKETAQHLKISFRTVENYIDQLKLKLNCSSRSSLIEKFIDSGAALMIPSSIFFPTN